MILFPNTDVTIYRHCLNENKLDSYERINIDAVNWNCKRNSTVSDKGVNIAYTTMIIAPGVIHKFTTGDRVVKGHIELDIAKIAELSSYNPVTIVGIQENKLFNTTAIECK